MVEQRQSIVKVGKELSDLVLVGGGNSSAARALAAKLAELCLGKGVYRKQHETHEDRVMHRHLNLYKNKLSKATSPYDVARWTEKVAEQERLMASRDGTLDLDGL